jgi:hypothetical protein
MCLLGRAADSKTRKVKNAELKTVAKGEKIAIGCSR